MKSPYLPPVIQAVGLACVPIDGMPAGSALSRKPVAAAIVTLHMRDDGHRDIKIDCRSDAKPFEFPLPVLVNDALITGAPPIISEFDRDTIMIEAAARRFFVEPKLGALATVDGLIDPATMLHAAPCEAALCRRLGLAGDLPTDMQIAQWWRPDAPGVAEGAALTTAVMRLMAWAHAASFLDGMPDSFFETLLPLRERLMDIEAQYPAVTTLLKSRPFGRSVSFARDYHAYRASRDSGDEDARWVTFEEGLSYV